MLLLLTSQPRVGPVEEYKLVQLFREKGTFIIWPSTLMFAKWLSYVCSKIIEVDINNKLC